jgi:protein O-mannosyl-transferase
MKIKCLTIFAIIALIVLLAIAYSNTFAVPFLYDDTINILENLSIHQLWPPWKSFLIPEDTGIANRPIINFSLAINYAISGYKVWSYHAVNLIIHIMATLTLFGIIRRTILISKINLNKTESLLFSFACALLWGLHPVQTQAVTYIIQRCESLMALFFLLTIYSALRGWQAESSKRWHLLAVMFFLLAIFSKEVAIVCPILLISYEWVFRRKNPLRSIKESPFLYSGLLLGCFITFIIVISGNTLVTRTYQRSYVLVDYWITQCEVIFHYLRLTVWPSDLVIDYGCPMAKVSEIWLFITGILLLLCLSVWSFYRRNVAGFLGTCFFLILSPTSLIPLNDIAFEHRIYLPIAAVIILMMGIIFGIYKWLQNNFKSSKYLNHSSLFLIILIICTGLILGFLTYQRNGDYRSEITIWSDTITKRPNNFRGYHGLGLAISKKGHLDEALKYLLYARRINPSDSRVNIDVGAIFLLMNRPNESIPFLREAMRITPKNPKTYNNMGIALVQTGMLKEGIYHFSEALRIKPDYVWAKKNLIRASASYKQSLSKNNNISK